MKGTPLFKKITSAVITTAFVFAAIPAGVLANDRVSDFTAIRYPLMYMQHWIQHVTVLIPNLTTEMSTL